MATRNETLLYLVEVGVKGADALRQLNADFDRMAQKQQRRRDWCLSIFASAR